MILIVVERKLANLEFHVLRKMVDTHTFVALWGKFGPSLQDVAMLTSLPLFGEAHATSLYPGEEDKKRIEFLIKSLLKSKY